MAFVVWNILDMLESSDEGSVKAMLSDFSCNKETDGKSVNLNPDIEHFINEETGSFPVSGFLIAQFGKNYAVDGGKRITGKELRLLAQGELTDAQHRIGGGIIYLDCLGDAQLISFYEQEGFKLFGARVSKDGTNYLQYMKFF